MFNEILGIPAHPLLVHAVVVFVPLQALAAVAYALVPFVRRYIAWAVIGLAVVAPLAALAAKLAGDNFKARLGITGADIDRHREYGGWALYASAILAVLMILLVFVQVSRERRARDTDHEKSETSKPGQGSKILAIVLTVGVLGMGGVAVTYVALAGHTGAKLVWGTR